MSRSLLTAASLLGLLGFWTSSSVRSRGLPELIVQKGHYGEVHSVAFSLDGRFVASASEDRTVKIWDVAADKLYRTLVGHDDEVRSVAFSPDGKSVASGSLDQTVKVWDVTTGNLLHTFKGFRRTAGWVRRRLDSGFRSVAFSPDSTVLAAASSDGTVRTWNVTTGKRVRSFIGYAEEVHEVHSVAFSPDGETLASASSDQTVRVWDLKTGKALLTLSGHRGAVEAVAYSPDGATLASGGQDKTVRLWNAATGEPVGVFEASPNAVSSVAFSPDGQVLATGSGSWAVRLWGTASGELLGSLEGHEYSVHSVTFSPDSRFLVSGSRDQTVKVWDVATSELVRDFGSYSNETHSMAFSPDGRFLATGGEDRLVRIWEAATGRLLASFRGHRRTPGALSFSPDGSLLASGGSVMVWEMPTGKLVHSLGNAWRSGTVGYLSALSFSPDGRTIAAAGVSFDSAIVKLWDVATGRQLHILSGHDKKISSLAFSRDSQVLATGSLDETVKIWDVESGQLLDSFGLDEDDQEHSVRFVALSPDGQTLAVVHEELLSSLPAGALKIWDVPSKKIVRAHSWHARDSKFASMTFSHDGRVLVAAFGSTSHVWNVTKAEVVSPDDEEMGKPEYLRSLEGHTAAVNALAISPDDRFLVSASSDSSLRTWRLADGEWLATSHVFDEGYLTYTPEGIYETSDPAARRVAWRLGDQIHEPEKYRRRFQRPDLVARSLAGQAVEVPEDRAPGDSVELVFAEGPPPALLTAQQVQINDFQVRVSVGEDKSLRFLGPSDYLKQGLNWFEARGQQMRFWYEEQKLLRVPEPYPNRYAILVAIDDYERKKDPRRGPTGFDGLTDMVARSEELKSALLEIGFREENIRTLYDQEATSSNVNQELYRFWQGETRSKTDLLFFYFGGHGRGAEGLGYLVTYDYDPERPARTSFLMSDIINRHFSYVDVKHMLVAVDACSSGLAIPGIRSLSAGEERRLKQFRKLSVVMGDTEDDARNLLVAGTGEERALYENGGIFTQALIEGLRGSADWNSDGVIQFEELALQLRNEVRAKALQTGVRQVPSYYIASRYGQGKVLFMTPP